MTDVWTREAVLALGIKTDVPTAGAILGNLCKDESYRMVKRGDFPVPVIKVGRKLFVPTAPILRLLDLDTGAAGPPRPADDTDHARPAVERLDDNAHDTRRRLRAIGS
jgi:hypothetical protein